MSFFIKNAKKLQKQRQFRIIRVNMLKIAIKASSRMDDMIQLAFPAMKMTWLKK